MAAKSKGHACLETLVMGHVRVKEIHRFLMILYIPWHNYLFITSCDPTAHSKFYIMMAAGRLMPDTDVSFVSSVFLTNPLIALVEVRGMS